MWKYCKKCYESILANKTFGKNTKEWHFTRQSDNVKNYTVSKVLDRIQANESHLPFLIYQGTD